MPKSLPQLAHQVEYLRLDGDVERGRRLVGDQDFGLHDSAIAIITRWRIPPDSSCGYCPMRRAASACARASSIVRARASALSPSDAPWARSPRSAAGRSKHGVERGHRLLENHGDVVAAHAAHGAVRRGRKIAPLRVRYGRTARAIGLRQQPHDRSAVIDFARAGLAGKAQRLAGRKSKETLSSTERKPSGVARIDAQVLDRRSGRGEAVAAIPTSTRRGK